MSGQPSLAELKKSLPAAETMTRLQATAVAGNTEVLQRRRRQAWHAPQAAAGGLEVLQCRRGQAWVALHESSFEP